MIHILLCASLLDMLELNNELVYILHMFIGWNKMGSVDAFLSEWMMELAMDTMVISTQIIT